ncbi:AAA family ATPase [Roseateles sp.]|uniref:AAA family ATPase n=1 Tax=Roseateles sp. TaxID=1971397 RepID=UPI002DFF004A|nr:AAA family ATPase [Roseateles sp.]
MLRVSSIGIENLRSLADTRLIQLKPITILVGRNSSGKSTFARLFPLLKQSAEASKKGPLLWWGRLVDFGSFEDAVSRYAPDESITLKFAIDTKPEEFRSISRRSVGRLSLVRLVSTGSVVIKATIKRGKNSAYVSKIELDAFGNSAFIQLDEHGFATEISSGSYKWSKGSQVIFYASQDKILPTPTCYKAASTDTNNTTYWEPHDVFRIEQAKILRYFLHGNTAEEKVRQLADKIPIGSNSDVYNSLCQITNPQSFRENLLHHTVDGYTFRRLCDVSFASHLESMMDLIGSALKTFSEEVIYLEPLRANAQRYYRQQSLAVGEIDSKGENIAMFLDNLSWSQLKDLNDWMEKHFGIRVTPSKQGGHISLKIKQSASGGETNIADMGFGFSQMLPIAVQLWAATLKTTNSAPWHRDPVRPTIVIEQPELHLHPDYQAKIADVFVAALGLEDSDATKARSKINIVAETHSADLINRIGALVAEKTISPDAVQVILFDQPNPQSSSTLTIAQFDADGVLTNWPTGFFTPSVYTH